MSQFIEYATNGTSTFTLAGALNGANRIFTLPVQPTSLQVFKNGQLLEGNSVDYVWNGFTVTVTVPNIPQSSDVIAAWVFTT